MVYTCTTVVSYLCKRSPSKPNLPGTDRDPSVLFADDAANSTCDMDYQSLNSNHELSLRKMLSLIPL